MIRRKMNRQPAGVLIRSPLLITVGVGVCLVCTNALNDLEDGRSADNKNKQSKEPWSHRVFFFICFQSFGNVSSVCYIFAVLVAL